MSVDDATRAWLHDLPKVELHVHLEGSMSVETVRRLAARHAAGTNAIWPDGLPDAFSFDGFPSFASQFFFGLSLLRSGADLATITDDLAATLASQNVRYAEVTTSDATRRRRRELPAGRSSLGTEDRHRTVLSGHVESGKRHCS